MLPGEAGGQPEKQDSTTYARISFQTNQEYFNLLFGKIYGSTGSYPKYPFLWLNAIIWVVAAAVLVELYLHGIPLFLIALFLLSPFGFRGIPQLFSTRARPDWLDPQERTLRLTDLGVEIDGGPSDTLIPWHNITDIREDKRSIRFEPSAFIPKRAFEQPDAIVEFLQIARRLLEKNGSNRPEPFQSELPAVKARFAYNLTEMAALIESYNPNSPVLSSLKSVGSDKPHDRVVSVISGLALAFGLLLFNLWTNRAWLPGALSTGVWPPGSFWMVVSIGGLPMVVLATSLFPYPKSEAVTFGGRNPMHVVTFDERGVNYEVHGVQWIVPWKRVLEVHVAKLSSMRIVRVENKNGKTSVSIPETAFASEQELKYFVDVGRAYVESARTLLPPRFPEPISWPPPPSV